MTGVIDVRDAARTLISESWMDLGLGAFVTLANACGYRVVLEHFCGERVVLRAGEDDGSGLE